MKCVLIFYACFHDTMYDFFYLLQILNTRMNSRIFLNKFLNNQSMHCMRYLTYFII